MQGNKARFLGHTHTMALAVAVAALVALLVLVSSPEARGLTAQPEIDKDPRGAPYAAGELLVTYDLDASVQDVDEVVEESDARVVEELPAPDAQLLSFPEAQDETTEAARERELREAKEILERDADVRYVDYNYLRLPAFEPNDPFFTPSEQWNLYKIDAPAAWNTEKGSGAKVAVVDSGIAANHPDLEGKIAAQIDEVGRDGDDVAEDNDGHGTHVAGTVAAATDNGKGVAAVCPSCKLLIARTGDELFFDADVVQGIYWSVDNRADAINISLSFDGDSRILENAVNDAWQQGVVVVAAAGNSGTDAPSYPAAYDKVISVAATNQNDRRAPFSNFGTTIDVAAPGVSITSTFPRTSDCGIDNIPDNVDYCDLSGTSMASPHVAGLAGLLAAQGRTAPEIRRQIEKTAVDLGKDGKDKYYGWGRIDARRAVIQR